MTARDGKELGRESLPAEGNGKGVEKGSGRALQKGPAFGQRVSLFLGNESSFGRLMQFFWVIIGGNLMFVLFSLPLITIGGSLCGLYRVCFRYLRGDRDLSPIREFWRGFKMNFRQGLLSELVICGFSALALVDIRFCDSYGGIFSYFKLLIYGLCFALFLLAIHFYPVLSAFSDTLGGLVRNAVFFTAKNPLRALLIAALHVVPVLVTIVNTHLQPLYVFLWASCGFGLIAMGTSMLLKRDFERFLPKVDAFGNLLTQEEAMALEREKAQEEMGAEDEGEIPTGKMEGLL